MKVVEMKSVAIVSDEKQGFRDIKVVSILIQETNMYVLIEKVVKCVNPWDGNPKMGDAEYGSGRSKIRQANPSQVLLTKTKAFKNYLFG